MDVSSVGGCVDERRRREIRRYFDRADKDKDGKLSQEEWHRILNASGVPTSKEEVEDFFRSRDRDFDGYLSFEEFLGEESKLEKLFKKMDTNNDGKVSKQEFQNICTNLSTEQIEAAFEKYDISGDDMLDYKEFCGMIHQNEENDEKK